MEMPRVNGEHGPKVHLLPELPKTAGSLVDCVELKKGESYLVDGRVQKGTVSCGWKAADVDVDVSLAVYDENHKCVDVIWWDKKHSHYVSATHLNDDRNGTPIGDSDVNEKIAVNFDDFPPSVYHLLVVLTVYSKGKKLNDVSDIFVKLSHQTKGEAQDLFRYSSPNFDTSGAVLGIFSRMGSWWNFTALGETAEGRSVKEVVYNMTLDQIVREAAVGAPKYKITTWAVEGHDLAASDYSFYGPRTSDCFVEIKYKGRRVVSEVIMKSLEPKWSMPKFEIGMANEAEHNLVEFEVWDHDTNSPDDFLGAVVVAVGGVCQKGVGKHNLELELGPSSDPEKKPKKGVQISGKLVVCFEVSAPEA